MCIFICSKYSSLNRILWCEALLFFVFKILPSPDINSTNLSMVYIISLIMSSRIDSVLIWCVGTVFCNFVRFPSLNDIFRIVARLAFLNTLSNIRVAGLELATVAIELLTRLSKLNYMSPMRSEKC
jgi:hypothetical protein